MLKWNEIASNLIHERITFTPRDHIMDGIKSVLFSQQGNGGYVNKCR